jgi:adenylate cyclase
VGVEIERKFLVDHEKWKNLKKAAGTHYRQGYLVDEENLTVRVRSAGKKGFITIKGRNTGITRKEFEYKLPAQDAAELIEGFAKSEFAGHLWEVDEFFGDNEGLIMAEIELKSETEEFEKPVWIINEVSDDDRYYNSNLSKNPYKNWGK